MKVSRRNFINNVFLGTAVAGLAQAAKTGTKTIQGFEDDQVSTQSEKTWKQKYDRKVRVGIVGNGVCHWGAAFGFQKHPNVEIIAVSDLIPERCADLAEDCNCEKTYPSLEELVKDDDIEAVFVATDAPSHANHVIEVLKHGKHAASAVPAVWGGHPDEADVLFEAVKSSGLNYMMFETSVFHEQLYAMRQIFKAGGFGKCLIYSEGEYVHYFPTPLASFKNWRVGLPPQWYPTHSNAYYVGVAGNSFTEVSCMGIPSEIDQFKPANNRYQNRFGTEIALLRTSEGGMARMMVSWDLPGGYSASCTEGCEKGLVCGVNGSYDQKYTGLSKNLPGIIRPPLPPETNAVWHGGSHGHLMNEFVMSIIENRRPLVDIEWALNMSVAGIVAHESALKGGELLKIPQYKL